MEVNGLIVLYAIEDKIQILLIEVLTVLHTTLVVILVGNALIDNVIAKRRLGDVSCLIVNTEVKLSLHTNGTEGSNALRRDVVLTVPFCTTIDKTILNGLAAGSLPTTQVTHVASSFSIDLTKLTCGSEAGIDNLRRVTVNRFQYLIIIGLVG